MLNRRNFLKSAGTLSAGVAVSPVIISCNKSKRDPVKFAYTLNEVRKSRKQHFNMCGYAAPPLEVVRVGFIGLGNRGPSSLRRLCLIEGVEIKAICDIRPDCLVKGRKVIADADLAPAREYGQTEDDFYKEFDTDSYRGNMNSSIIKTGKGGQYRDKT